MDFNTHQDSYLPPKEHHDHDVTGHCKIITVDTPSKIIARDVFQHDVFSRLPYTLYIRAEAKVYYGLMIDDQRIVAMNVRNNRYTLKMITWLISCLEPSFRANGGPRYIHLLMAIYCLEFCTCASIVTSDNLYCSAETVIMLKLLRVDNGAQ
jgi:hypothetical protein